MEFLSEDATYLAGGLGLVGVVFLIALRVTQQGKYLAWTLASWGLALSVIGIEQVWVTDAERIERVVYELKRALGSSDTEGVLRHLTADVQFAVGQGTKEKLGVGRLRYANLLTGAATRTFIKSELEQCTFDVVRITRLETHVSPQARRGVADFRILVSGRYRDMVGTSPSDWSLGFRETSPKVWQVDRISPTGLPSDIVPQATGGLGSGSFPNSKGRGGSGGLPFRVPGGSP